MKVCVEYEIWRSETPKIVSTLEASIMGKISGSFTGTEDFKESLKFIVFITLSVMREFRYGRHLEGLMVGLLLL